MAKVVFILPDGRRVRHETQREGDTVMDVAVDNGVPGIVGQCGGGCTCGTCHCWVEPRWLPGLPEPHPDEAELLDYLPGRADDSRLACQLPVEGALDGIEVRLPLEQG